MKKRMCKMSFLMRCDRVCNMARAHGDRVSLIFPVCASVVVANLFTERRRASCLVPRARYRASRLVPRASRLVHTAFRAQTSRLCFSESTGRAHPRQSSSWGSRASSVAVVVLDGVGPVRSLDRQASSSSRRAHHHLTLHFRLAS